MGTDNSLERNPQRKSLRLRSYDYSNPGAYFVTICAQRKRCLFGHVVGGAMVRNNIGKMVKRVWEYMPRRFISTRSDCHIIMPNHMHGIIVIGSFVGAGLALPTDKGAASGAPTLGDVVRAFKSISTIRVNRLLGHRGRLWQRNYYEHVIRNDKDLDRIREYILNNPVDWAQDRENPVGRPPRAAAPWEV